MEAVKYFQKIFSAHREQLNIALGFINKQFCVANTKRSSF